MAESMGAVVALCAATSAASFLAARHVARRKDHPEATAGRDGAAIFWLGYGLLFAQSALLLGLAPQLHSGDVAFLLVLLGSVAFCVAGAGMTAHVIYLWRGRTAWPAIAGLWATVLSAMLAGNVLFPPEGYLATDDAPLVGHAVAPPWWLMPAAGSILALPMGIAAFLYLEARGGLQGGARRRAGLHAVSLGCAAAWTWWTVMVIGFPHLAESAPAVHAARLLGALPPFLLWVAQLLEPLPAPVSGRPLAATNR